MKTFFTSLLLVFFLDHSFADETNIFPAGCTTNSMREISTKVEAGYSNFIPAVSNSVQTTYGSNAASAAAKLVSILETNMQAALNNTNSALPEIGAASEYFKKLKKEGRLPGVLKEQHGTANLNLPSEKVLELKYPFSVPFDVVLEGASFTNHYTLLRATKDSAWRLERAWQTDSNGNTIVEWPTK